MNPSLLPSFRLRDVDHVVIGFDIARCDGEQLADSHPSAPQHPQHEVVPRAVLVRGLEHPIDLLPLEVVGDMRHNCRKE